MDLRSWLLLTALASACNLLLAGSAEAEHLEQQQQLRGLSRGLLRFPEYKHGPAHRLEYILSQADRENGITYLPAGERLRVVVDKLMRGQNVSLVTVGSSIMAGEQTYTGPSLPQYIYYWLNNTYPGQVTWSSGAVPGTTSAYLAACHNILVPPNADLVIVDYSVSDWHNFGIPFHNEPRRAFERLVRKLLTYPNRPAVILMHAYAYNVRMPLIGTFWSNSEREFGEFERFYHLPALSTKAAAFHHMTAQREGFYTKPRENWTESTRGQYFYMDNIHPDATAGCRVMAELVSHLVTKVATGLLERPLTPLDRAVAQRDIPAPMIPGNYESRATRCFIAQAFMANVQAGHAGWDWVNESKSRRPKWGYTSTQPGSTIRLLVDSRPTSRDVIKHNNATDEKAAVQLMYLRSYVNMGQALVRCEEGCRCGDSVFDGHHEQRNSLMFLHRFSVSSAERCVFSITVTNGTSSNTTTAAGGHKVKLGGVIVSEVAGAADQGMTNEGALAYAADIAMIATDGTFDGKNHA